ncbi:hypothetical protein ACTXT7_007358 [Hymenolepis weldensis]
MTTIVTSQMNKWKIRKNKNSLSILLYDYGNSSLIAGVSEFQAIADNTRNFTTIDSIAASLGDEYKLQYLKQVTPFSSQNLG